MNRYHFPLNESYNGNTSSQLSCTELQKKTKKKHLIVIDIRHKRVGIDTIQKKRDKMVKFIHLHLYSCGQIDKMCAIFNGSTQLPPY